MSPNQPNGKAPPPSFLGRYFNTTAKAQKLMHSDGRICELDRSSHERVLVYNVDPPKTFCEVTWSQSSLYKAAINDPTLRISRKPLTGTSLEILQRDIFNEGPELDAYGNKPTMNVSLMKTELGFFQARHHRFVYIMSRKNDTKSGTSSFESVSTGNS